MKRTIAISIACLLLFASVGQATVTLVGDVSPYHETLWGTDYDAVVGGTSGVLSSATIDAESTLGCNKLYIADVGGSEAFVTVDGSGSVLNVTSTFYMDAGDATLNITNGGSVPVSGAFLTGTAAGAEATVVMNNGTLSTGGVNLSKDADAIGTYVTMTNGSVWDCNNYFNFGDYGPVTFSIESGSVVNCVRGYIARFASDGKTPSDGNVTVTGAGSALNMTGSTREFHIGGSGTATLLVADGAAVNAVNTAYIGVNSGSSGEVTVTGANSIFDCNGEFRVGSSGEGTLDILAGGTMETAGSSYIGANAGSTGEVTVSGTDAVSGASSTWTSAASVWVGRTGDGTLDINDGGAVSCGNLFIAENADSEGSVTVSNGSLVSNATFIGKAVGASGSLTISNGGTWNSGSYFELGSNGGDATFRVESGGVANTNRVYIGRQPTTTAANVSATVTGAGSEWIVPGSNFRVGYNSDATLSITEGGTVTRNGDSIIGDVAGVTGTATVSGGTWDNSGGYLRVGNSGTGSLTVSNSGVVHSGELRVGSSGTGTVTIETGGVVNAGLIAIARNDGAGNSAISVSGSGSALNSTSEIIVGRNETGTLSVTGGATVSNDTDAWVGYRGAYDDGNGGLTSATGTATISGTDSSWNVGGVLSVAAYADTRTFPSVAATGTLNIEDSAEVTVAKETFVGQRGATATIDFDNGTLTTGSLGTDFANLAGTGTIDTKGIVANGSLTFDATNGLTKTYSNVGADSGVTINLDVDGTGTVGVGYDTAGTLTIADGVVVESTDGILARTMDATATASVSGEDSAWNVAGTLYVGQMGAATLTITDGGLVSAGTLYIDQDISIEAEGVADPEGGFNGFYNYVNFTGDPEDAGDPEDQFSIVADSFVNLSDGGMLALAGDLSADLDTFIAAIQGSSDAIQWWDESGSDWASLSTATLDTDCTLEYIDSGDLVGYTLLTVGSAEERIPGDANHDGKVDGSDVTILANNWQAGVSGGGEEVTWEKGDFNGDHKVDGSDVTILANNWQKGVGGMAHAAVPEPSVLVMILGAMLVGWVLRRK